MLLWRVLGRVWPNTGRAEPALWGAALFAVYPAFKQMPLALEYFPHFIALGMLFGSLWASLRLAADPPENAGLAWLLRGLAWLGSFQVFILEYFVGLEVLRPILTWLVWKRQVGARAATRRALLAWLPFLPVLAGFLAWRVFGLGFPSYQPGLLEGLAASPTAALAELLRVIAHDAWLAGVVAWAQPFTLVPAGKTGLVWAGLVGLTLAGAAGFLFLRQSVRTEGKGGPPPSSSTWPLEVLGVGLVGLLAAGWPFWITQIPLELTFPWDRPSLAFLVGACLSTVGAVGLLGYVPGRRVLQPLALALLLASSTGLHFQNANLYRKESAIVTPFFWQLAWRAPGLQPGTAIILDQTPFNYHVDKFLAPLVSLTYAPESGSLSSPYWLFDYYKLAGSRLPPVDSNALLETRYGTLSFRGSVKQILVVVYSPPGCLRVLAPGQVVAAQTSKDLDKTVAYSNPNLIVPDPAQAAAPPAVLGPEPDHGWCYYLEKTELALQSEDYAAAAALGDEALALGLAPAEPGEYLPVVEAYARLGRWEEARALTQQAAQSETTWRAACSTWERLSTRVDAEEARAALEILACGEK